MTAFIDFEDLISLNEKHSQKESGYASKHSQEPLSVVLDKMCETVDVDKMVLSDENLHELPNVVHIVKLGEVEMFHDDCIFKDNTHLFQKIEESGVEKFERNEYPPLAFNDIEDRLNSTDNRHNVLHSKRETVIEYNAQENEEIDLSPTTIGLAEFKKIYNETCVANCKNILRTDNDENTVSLYTNLSENSITIIDDTIINLDELYSIINESDNLDKIGETVTNHIEMSETENEESAKRVRAVFDSNFINIESNANSRRGTDDNDVCTNKTKPSDTTAIKDLKFEVPSHYKTIQIDLTNDDVSISSDSDDGYNSSDFEFISESEAKKGGLLVNGANSNIKALNTRKQTESNLPDSNPDYIKYHRNQYTRLSAAKAKADRESHVIPEGESFLDLFRGVYSPIMMNGFFYTTNKQVLPAKSMTLDTDGIDFDLPPKAEKNLELQNEAMETVKKIRFLYPDENRKRRRLQ